MAWTLTHDGTTQTVEAWGLAGLKLESRNFDVGTASFSHPAGTYDGAALFAYGEAAIIKLDEVIVFQGTFDSPKRSGRGAEEMVNYVLRDVWWNLTRLPYPPSPTSGVIEIFTDSETIAETYQAVIDYAAGVLGTLQFGSAANLGVAPLQMESRDELCAGVLLSLRKWCPDVNHRIDHSTTPPTIHFIRRADATALDLALEGTADTVQIDSLEDLVTTQVRLRYLRTIEGVEEPETEVLTDHYPVDGLATEGALVASFDLRGKTLETQSLVSRNISSSSRAWWSRFYPWIAPGNAELVEGDDFGFTDTERLMQDVDGEWITDTSGSTYEIEDGGVPQWQATAKQVLVKAVLNNFTLDGEHHADYELQTTLNASPLAGGKYTRVTFEGESPPSGLAQQIYAATSVLHYRGQYEYTADELSLPLPHCGNVLNLTGGSAAARGWTTMRAVIQGVTVDVQSARVSLTFGPPEAHSPQDLMELSRLRGHTTPAPKYQTGASGGGIRRAAGNNSMPPKPSAPVLDPLKAYSVGGGAWCVRPGNVNGTPVTAADGTPLSDIPPPQGTQENGKIWLEFTASLTFDEGYLMLPADITTVKVKAGASVPADTEPAASGTWIWNIELATLEDFIPSGNTFGSSLSAFVEDASDEDTLHAVLRTLRT